MKPQIILDQGFHNNNPLTQERLIKGKTFEDLSTICVVPSRGTMPTRVVQSWMSMMSPMNQKFIRLFVIGMEIGDAYNSAIEMILSNPDLSKWKYLLTIEDDNIPPPDGLLNLYEGMKDYDVVGGLYWTKGYGGQPMCYGDPKINPINFIPQLPTEPKFQACRGLGMGFNLWKISMFKDNKLPKPWFKTQQEFIPNEGTRAFTQDLYFFHNAGKLGYKFACANHVKVGHYDFEGRFGEPDTVW